MRWGVQSHVKLFRLVPFRSAPAAAGLTAVANIAVLADHLAAQTLQYFVCLSTILMCEGFVRRAAK